MHTCYFLNKLKTIIEHFGFNMNLDIKTGIIISDFFNLKLSIWEKYFEMILFVLKKQIKFSTYPICEFIIE